MVVGGESVSVRSLCQSVADWVLLYVGDVGPVILCVCDAAAVVAGLPYIELAFEAEGEASFDVLHCFFERDFWRGRQQEMDVVGHDDEGV